MIKNSDNKKQSILLVDDEPELLELFAEYISDLGIKIFKAGNGQEALAVIENNPVDVILTDLRMPVMGGIDFIKNLRAKGFWNPVMILTGHGEKKAVVEALRLGVYEFLDKPIDEETLMREVKKVLQFSLNVNAMTAEAPESLRQSIYYMELLKTRTGT